MAPHLGPELAPDLGPELGPNLGAKTGSTFGPKRLWLRGPKSASPPSRQPKADSLAVENPTPLGNTFDPRQARHSPFETTPTLEPGTARKETPGEIHPLWGRHRQIANKLPTSPTKHSARAKQQQGRESFREQKARAEANGTK